MSQPTSAKLSFSIVVIEVAGGEVLERCLKMLQQFDLACVVVLREKNSQLQTQFNTVLFDVLDKPVPLRRKRGVALATGDVVTLIEDTTIPDDTLLEGLTIAFEEDECLAASGPITIGQNLSERYQALACTEYGRYHSTMLFGKDQQQRIFVDRLPGNFICYRRNALNLLMEVHEEGLIESIVNHQLLSRGAKLVMVPKLAATYCGKDTWGARFSTRFHHGWIYAGGMVEGKGIGVRIIQSIKSLLLPVVLSSRAIRSMSGMREINQPVHVALWICVLELSWSTGEFIGSLFGKPETMEYWR
jgi:hypothetical protein